MESWSIFQFESSALVLNALSVGNILCVSVSIFLILLGIYYYFTYFSRTARLINKFPKFSIKINTSSSMKSFSRFSLSDVPSTFPARVLTNLFKNRGKTIRVWLLIRPVIFTSDIGLIEKILSSSKHVQKGDMVKSSEPWLGKGLGTADLQVWRTDRKLLVPAFKSNFYEEFMQSFNKHSRRLVKNLLEKYPTGNEVNNIHPDIGRTALDIICDTALNIQPESNDLYEVMCSIIHLILVRVYKPWVTIKLIWEILGYGKVQRNCIKTIQKLVSNDVVKSRKIKLNEPNLKEETLYTNSSRRKFLDLLLVHNYPSKTMHEHVTSILLAGFETTAAAMNHFLFCLACYPDIQKKIYDELCVIFDSSDFGKDATMADIKDMKYLELCLKESMRLYPPAPLLARKVQSDIVLDNGLIIPNQTNVNIMTWDVHHDPDNYPNPEVFNPERFLPENCIGRSLYSFLAFSCGPRNCLGQKYVMMEMKVMLSHILRNYEITTTHKMEDVRFKYGIVIHPDVELNFTLKRRNRN